MRVDCGSVVVMLLAAFGIVATASGAGAAQVIIIEQTASGTTFDVIVPDPDTATVMVDTMPFVTLAIEGASPASLEAGKPQVLRVPVLLAVPNGCSTAVSVILPVTHDVSVGRVYPEQPPVSLNDTIVPFEFDRPFYDTSDVFYPGVYVRTTGSGVWRDLQVLNLDVMPVHVNPVQGTIRVANRVRVAVSYYYTTAYPTTVADWMVPLYARFVNNFSELTLPVTSQDSVTGIKCMVFCHSSYDDSDSVKALLQWIKRRGYEDTLIYGAWGEGDTAVIRDMIRDEYRSHPDPVLRWVLLIGEAAAPIQIPVHDYPYGHSGHVYSDFYYSCLDDTGLCSSPGFDDLYPDVCVSRISPRNGSRWSLDTIIGKILRYQRDPPLTGDWLANMTFVANKKVTPVVFWQLVQSVMNMPYYRYWDPDTGKSFINGFIEGEDNADVTNALNTGTGCLLYAGHGDCDRWQWWNKTMGHTNWKCSDIYALQNGGMTPVVFNVACLCGKINGTGTSDRECLAEAWIRKTPGGAVASFGATDVVSNHAVSQCTSLVRALCDYDTVAGYAPTFDLGSVKMYSDAYFMAGGHGSSEEGIRALRRFLMLGDPTMPVWIGGMPETANVAGFPDSFPVDLDTVCTLTVTLKGTNTPVEAALACICGGGEYAVVDFPRYERHIGKRM